MNEKALTVLEQYDFTVKEIYRMKGNYGCITDKGKFILQEYNNGEGRAKAQNRIGAFLEDKGISSDFPIKNKEDKYISVSVDGYTYIMKKWFNARECDIKEKDDIINAVRALGRFHSITRETGQIWDEECSLHNIGDEINVYIRHNKEMIKVRNYINKRKNKTEFELDLQNQINTYYNQGVYALQQIEKSSYKKLYEKAVDRKSVCHGGFNHHSVIFENERPSIINMRKFGFGFQLYDFYGYLRKIMEKNNWDIQLAGEVLAAYQEDVEMTGEDMQVLWCFFVYPEKFWKIVNYYFNSNKAWSSDKNQEKLKQFQFQEEKRQEFVGWIKKSWE